MGNLYIAQQGTESRLHGAIYICFLSACQVCLKQHQQGVTSGPNSDIAHPHRSSAIWDI